jgi:CheY-like chemotaxis protein
MAFEFEKLSVLIVEDNDAMIELIFSVLEAMNVGTIHRAQSAERAFEIFCLDTPDIIITDWHMEPVSGIELIQKIRTDPASPNKTVPVIVMTGFSALKRVTIARDVGATEYIVKPFTAKALARRIAYVINRPRAFIRSPGYFGPDRRRRMIEGYEGPKRRSEDDTEKT